MNEIDRANIFIGSLLFGLLFVFVSFVATNTIVEHYIYQNEIKLMHGTFEQQMAPVHLVIKQLEALNKELRIMAK